MSNDFPIKDINDSVDNSSTVAEFFQATKQSFYSLLTGLSGNGEPEVDVKLPYSTYIDTNNNLQYAVTNNGMKKIINSFNDYNVRVINNYQDNQIQITDHKKLILVDNATELFLPDLSADYQGFYVDIQSLSFMLKINVSGTNNLIQNITYSQGTPNSLVKEIVLMNLADSVRLYFDGSNYIILNSTFFKSAPTFFTAFYSDVSPEYLGNYVLTREDENTTISLPDEVVKLKQGFWFIVKKMSDPAYTLTIQIDPLSASSSTIEGDQSIVLTNKYAAVKLIGFIDKDADDPTAVITWFKEYL